MSAFPRGVITVSGEVFLPLEKAVNGVVTVALNRPTLSLPSGYPIVQTELDDSAMPSWISIDALLAPDPEAEAVTQDATTEATP